MENTKENGMMSYADASVAALFLSQFIESSISWAHLDIAGVTFNGKYSAVNIAEQPTGYGVKLFYNLISQ